MPSPAHEAICEFAEKYKGKLNILCMGPLTNLANAIIHDKKIKNKINHVYIMGMNRFGEVIFLYVIVTLLRLKITLLNMQNLMRIMIL